MSRQNFLYPYEGVDHPCSYTVTGGRRPLITVTTPWGSKSTQLGGSPPLVLAKLLAGELARTARHGV
jgi:hypothetical protein